jgi:predicted SprT family Zn-dependent metalloprotease
MTAVYFLKAVQSGWIKIGYSKQPKKRHGRCATDCPHEHRLMKVIEGGLDTEHEWHKRFSHLRGHGEWFKSAPDLLEAIDNEPPDPEHVVPQCQKPRRRARYSLRCGVCGTEHADRTEQEQHIIEHHRSMRCRRCRKTFKGTIEFNLHHADCIDLDKKLQDMLEMILNLPRLSTNSRSFVESLYEKLPAGLSEKQAKWLGDLAYGAPPEVRRKLMEMMLATEKTELASTVLDYFGHFMRMLQAEQAQQEQQA